MMGASATDAMPPDSTQLVRLLDAAAVFVTAELLLVAGLDLQGWVRLLLALAFVTFVPGWAVLDHVPLAVGWSRLALAVAFSLSLCTAAATALAWSGHWQPVVLFYVLGGLSIVALLAHLVKRP